MQRRGTVLVADDEPDILSLSAASPGDEDCAVAAVSSGDDAIAALARSGLDPWTALGRIRAAAGTTPVIICSAHTPGAFAGFAERGFAALIQKPFDLDRFVHLVRLTSAGAAAGSPQRGQQGAATFQATYRRIRDPSRPDTGPYCDARS